MHIFIDCPFLQDKYMEWEGWVLYYLYIFLKYTLNHFIGLCTDFYYICTKVGCWSSVFIRRIINVFLMYFLLITQLLWLVRRLGSRKPV